MSISAQNASDRAEQVIALTKRLIERLRLESAAIKDHDQASLREGIEETRQLSNLYRYETTRIQNDPSLLSEAAPPLKEALITTTVEFQELLKSHAALVEAAKSVTEGLITTIANEANKHKQMAQTYGPGAKAAQSTHQSLNLGATA